MLPFEDRQSIRERHFGSYQSKYGDVHNYGEATFYDPHSKRWQTEVSPRREIEGFRDFQELQLVNLRNDLKNAHDNAAFLREKAGALDARVQELEKALAAEKKKQAQQKPQPPVEDKEAKALMREVRELLQKSVTASNRSSNEAKKSRKQIGRMVEELKAKIDKEEDSGIGHSVPILMTLLEFIARVV